MPHHTLIICIRKVFAVAAGLMALAIAGCAHPPAAEVAAGPGAADSAWEPFALPGKRLTAYARGTKHGVEAWHAQADRSASMWRRRLPLAPDRIGHVEFSWFVPALIPDADLSIPEAEDSPVRVIFAFDGDRSQLSARNKAVFELAALLTGEAPPYATLMYVWDARAAHERVLVSGRSDRIRKIVVESGDAHLRQWRHYRRNLRQDFIRAFGEEPGPLLGLAVMTDGDNTGSRTEAWYGDIRVD